MQLEQQLVQQVLVLGLLELVLALQVLLGQQVLLKRLEQLELLVGQVLELG